MSMSIGATIGYGFMIYDAENENVDSLFSIASELQDYWEDYSYSCTVDDLSYYEIMEHLCDLGFSYYQFGHYDYAYYALLIEDSVSSTDWFTEHFELNKLKKDPEWDKKVIAIQEKYGLDKVKPGWIFGGYVS